MSAPKLKRIAAPEPTAIDVFVSMVQKGISCWVLAGEMLVEFLKDDPDFFNKVQQAHPEISLDTLAVFERIGRKQIYAPLLANSSFGARQLMELPYDVQERCASTPLEIVVQQKGGGFTRVKKMVGQLNRSETAQIFDWENVRTPEQQVRYLKDRTKTMAPVVVAPVRKVTEMVSHKLKVDGSGNFYFEVSQKNGREYSVRMLPVGNGYEATVLLYK